MKAAIAVVQETKILKKRGGQKQQKTRKSNLHKCAVRAAV